MNDRTLDQPRNRPPGRPALQRVPPHDRQLEGHLIGAALLDPEAARLVADLGADPFYDPAMATIADTVRHLQVAGQPVDAGTVAAQLTNTGQADAIGGIATLTDLMAACPSTRSAATHAQTLTAYWHDRQLLTGAAEIVEAVYQRLPTAGLIAALHQQAAETAQGRAATWEPVNLTQVLAGDQPTVAPAVWARTDGQLLLYPGKTHAINAEPEAGKSWCMQHASAQQIADGRHVLYIDFEADAADVATRILELGCTPAQVINQFHYIRPEEPVGPDALLRILAACEAWQPTLAVIDGYTEALALSGWKPNDGDDIVRFLNALPRPLERHGCAVCIIDHVPKDPETQRRGGIGSEHKLAGITGADYKLESLTPFARNNPGSSRLICDKDRLGQVRPHCKDLKLCAVIHFKPLPGGYGIDITVDPYDNTQPDQEPFQPTGIMERISHTLAHGPALTSTEIRGAVRGAKTDTVRLALRLLVTGGYVTTMREGHSVYHSNLKPYPDPQPDQEEPYEDEQPF